MLAHLLSAWDRIRNSLWALPLAIAAGCALLATASLNLDLPIVTKAGWLYSGATTQAPEFASALVGAMITLTALAFSITMVVLTLAAQQLGPRLIQIFMSDRSTQSALGLFLGSVIYLLLVLRVLDGDAESEAPNLAISVGTLLVLASIITLLFFVHSLARSSVADHVIARVGDSLDRGIDHTFPAEADDSEEEAPTGGAPIHLEACGYVQRIDYGSLAENARRLDAKIVLAYRPGAHVVAGEAHGWTSGAAPDKELCEALEHAVVIARERTEGQDPEWSVRQLVEIALRALSPGINDEFTAIAVVDRLTRALSTLLPRHDPIGTWRDEEDAARVFGPAPTFALMLDAAFDQIRESGAQKSRVLLRLAESLDKLAKLSRPRHAAAIERHLKLVERAAGREIEEDMERAEIEKQIRSGRDALGEAANRED